MSTESKTDEELTLKDLYNAIRQVETKVDNLEATVKNLNDRVADIEKTIGDPETTQVTLADVNVGITTCLLYTSDAADE